MLSDSSHEIRQQADSALAEFLQEIKNAPVRKPSAFGVLVDLISISFVNGFVESFSGFSLLRLGFLSGRICLELRLNTWCNLGMFLTVCTCYLSAIVCRLWKDGRDSCAKSSVRRRIHTTNVIHLGIFSLLLMHFKLLLRFYICVNTSLQPIMVHFQFVRPSQCLACIAAE